MSRTETPIELWPAPVAPAEPILGPDQRRAADLARRRPGVLVLGAPGSGRTTTALAVVNQALADGVSADRVLLLAPTRRQSARLRDRLSATLDVTTGQPMVRTPMSLAFSILRARAVGDGQVPPTLISGPEQDNYLADLLAGHVRGDVPPLDLPDSVPARTLGLRAFRAELRDLLMRTAERGLDPIDLDEVGAAHARPEWRLAAHLYQEYLDVLALRRSTPDAPARYDPAVIVSQAVATMDDWPGGPTAVDRPRWDVVVVDDYQDATAATARLLAILAAGGARLALFGNPDLAVQTYRGGTPALLAAASEAPLGLPRVVLTRGRRSSAPIAEACTRVASRIRTVGIAPTYRRCVPTADGAAGPGGAGPVPTADGVEPVQVAVLSSPAQEAAWIAWTLRRAHLTWGLSWDRMAVLTRTGARIEDLRSALAAARVPITVPGAEVPVRDEPAARPLLTALRCAVALAQDDPAPDAVSAETAVELLTSPLGGMDSLDVRRLRRALRAREAAEGGARSSDQLLVELMTGNLEAPFPVGRRAMKVADLLAAGRQAARTPGAAKPDAPASTVLWALWEATGLAEVWRGAALSGGVEAERADRDLDAVMALFRAAEQFDERYLSAAGEFVEYLGGQDLPGDTLAARAPEGGSVMICTAASAVGLEWDLVVVAGVQDGVWPDLRLRDSLLGAGDLVELLEGRSDGGRPDPTEARRAVLDDELRSFLLAISRARSALVVTAASDADQRPSPLLEVLDPDTDPEAWARQAPLPMDLRGLVAHLRAVLTGATEAAEGHCDAGGAAVLLAALAGRGVAGADPVDWFGLEPATSDEPLYREGEVVRLSPSRVEAVETCPLRWALETARGRPASGFAQGVGTLVHSLAQDFPDADAETLRRELRARWPLLNLPDTWLTRRELAVGMRMVDRLAAYNTAHPNVVGRELDVDATVGGVRVVGRIDRVERLGPDLVRIVDFKTGKVQLTAAQAQANPQLGAYQAAVDAGGLGPDLRSGGAALVYLRPERATACERPQKALDQAADPAWMTELLTRARTRVAAASFRATCSTACRTCPVRRSCPAQPEGGQVTA